MAMQGGLLASVVANQQELERTISSKASKNHHDLPRLDWPPVIMFLGAKLVSHVVLGALLGLLGSAISLSLGVRLTFQVFTALFMFATAMNLLDVHPFFRFVMFQPPKFLQRIVRNSKNSTTMFAPALLGFLTLFIPCGVTQAMEVQAINSGNPVQGALILFAFVLGTTPMFAFLGIATAKLSETWYGNFSRIAAALLIAMAVYSLNGVLVVTNSPFTINKLLRPVTYFFSEERFTTKTQVTVPVVDGAQVVKIGVFNQGYSPNYFRVVAGVPVQLTLESNETYSCALAFVFKEFEINTFLASTDSQTFFFTPQTPGKYLFTCSMGMYTGTVEVI